MKSVLVLGAGHSAPFLISELLGAAEALDARIVVADLDGAAAERRVAGHARGRGLALDFRDEAARRAVLAETDLVVNLLPASFQPLVARACVAAGTHMVSASYTSPTSGSWRRRPRRKESRC